MTHEAIRSAVAQAQNGCFAELNAIYPDEAAALLADRDRLAAEVEAMKGHINMALTYLGPTAPECSGCAYEWDQAIKELRAAIPEEKP